jgi:hypothetical protein
VKGDLANDQLSGPGLELERALNRLTVLAELAVQDSDPVQCFLRTMSSPDLTGKNDTFEV